MAGVITLSCSIIKGGVEKFALKQPIFLLCLWRKSVIDYVLTRHYSRLPSIPCTPPSSFSRVSALIIVSDLTFWLALAQSTPDGDGKQYNMDA